VEKKYMGEMRDGIHDGFCTDEHYCECHCSKRFESEAPTGCIDTDCPIEQQYDDDDEST